MGDNDIKGKVGLDTTDFKTGVKELNRQIRVIESGFRAAAAGSERWTKDADALDKRLSSLTDIIKLQEKKVEATRKEYERIAKEKGKTSKAAQNLEVKLNNEVRALERSKTNLDRTKKSLAKVKLESQNTEKAIERMGKATDRAASVAKAGMAAVATAAAAAGAAVLAFGKKGLDLASDLEEVENVVDTTFGDQGSAKIDKWAKDAAEQFGLAELQAKQFNGTMGAMLKSMGLGQDDVLDMSQSISGLAGDFASFYNIASEDAFAKIRAGISGETEPLKQLGINMSVANLEAYALSQGIDTSYKSMTQAEQATLRYNYLMSVSADAQGDFARTSDSYANQQRIFSLEVQNLASSFGEKLLPAATEALKLLVDGIKNIDPEIFNNIAETLSNMAVSMAETAIEIIPKIIEFVEFIMANGDQIIAVILGIGAGMVAWNVVAIIQGVIASIKTWQAATQGMTVAQRALNLVMAANPIGIVITVVAALTAAIIYLWNTNEDFRRSVIAAWENVKNAVSQAILSMQAKIAEIKNSILDLWENAVQAVDDAIQAIKDKFKEWVQLGENLIDGIKQGVANAAGRLKDAVLGSVEGAIDSLKERLGISSPARMMDEEIGQPIGDGIAQGIEKSKSSVETSMTGLVDILKQKGKEALEQIGKLNADLQEKISYRKSSIGTVADSLRSGKIDKGTAKKLRDEIFKWDPNPSPQDVPAWITHPTYGADDPRIEEYKKQGIIENVNINVKSPAEAVKEIEVLDKKLALDMR